MDNIVKFWIREIMLRHFPAKWSNPVLRDRVEELCAEVRKETLAFAAGKIREMAGYSELEIADKIEHWDDQHKAAGQSL